MSNYDLNAIRNRLKSLQAKTSGNKYKWKPEPGLNEVRIVPYQHERLSSDTPFFELYFHYNIGKKSYLSPVTFNEADPIMEFSQKLKDTGDKEDWILSKKMEPTLRVFAPIIVRGKEKEGVKFWGFGKEIYQELLAVLIDPDYGDISDLSKGRDIKIEYVTPKEAGNTYGKVSVRVKPNQCVATDDPAVKKLILEEQPQIFDVFPKSTYEELKEALQKWLNPEEAVKEVADEDLEKARKAAGLSKSEPSKESVGTPEGERESKKTSKVAEEKSDADLTSPDSINQEFEKLFLKKT